MAKSWRLTCAFTAVFLPWLSAGKRLWLAAKHIVGQGCCDFMRRDPIITGLKGASLVGASSGNEPV